jgi:hypothetical protein
MKQENGDCVVYRFEIAPLRNSDYSIIVDNLQTELSGSSVIIEVSPCQFIIIFKRNVISEAEMRSKMHRVLENACYNLEKVAEL